MFRVFDDVRRQHFVRQMVKSAKGGKASQETNALKGTPKRGMPYDTSAIDGCVL